MSEHDDYADALNEAIRKLWHARAASPGDVTATVLDLRDEEMTRLRERVVRLERVVDRRCDELMGAQEEMDLLREQLRYRDAEVLLMKLSLRRLLGHSEGSGEVD